MHKFSYHMNYHETAYRRCCDSQNPFLATSSYARRGEGGGHRRLQADLSLRDLQAIAPLGVLLPGNVENMIIF